MGVELRVRTLGRLHVSIDEQPLPEPLPAKIAGLIVYLGETGEHHTRSALAGLMWSDITEDAARANLRQALTKLRKIIPEHLDTRRSLVGLVGPVWMDTHALAAAGAELADLYRGDFLDGFEPAGAELFAEWAAARRALHRTTALAALDQEVAAALAEGRLSDGITAARRILEIDPTNEATHSSLMRLFMAEGQPSGAIAQFETCRHILMEELAITPADATRELVETARRMPSSAPRRPVRRMTSPATTFVGRESELARIIDLLGAPECRVLSLVGPGGVGKTRLAVEVATRLEDGDFEVAVVPLVGLVAETPQRAAELVVTEIARALGIVLAEQRDPLELMLDLLAHRRLALVLDNFEHLLDASDVVAAMGTRLPNIRLLVTTRRRLGLGDEWVIELSGLGYPPEAAAVDLHAYPAVEMFLDRLRASPDASSPADIDAIVSITRMVEGLPLALELAARRARTIPAREIVERLSADLDILAGSAPDVPERHRSMRSVLDWSWGLLSGDAKNILAACSVFRGRFDLEAVEAVSEQSVIAPMDELVATSMIRLNDRFEMHELVRAYAAQQLGEDPGADAVVRSRHAHHFAARLVEGWQADDLEDLRAATDWLLDNGSPELLGEHLDRMWDVQRRLGAYAEARTVFESALERSDAPAIERARWHQYAAYSQLQIGRLPDTQRHLTGLLRSLDTPFPRSRPALLVKLVGQVARRALPFRGAARSEARRERARYRGQSLNLMGETFYLLENRLPVALAAVWALNEGEVAGDRGAVLTGRAETAMVASAIGWRRVARRYAEAAVRDPSVDPAGDDVPYRFMVTTLVWLGSGSWREFDAVSTRALDEARRVREPRMEEQAVLLQAVGELVRGRFDRARGMAHEALALARPRGALGSQGWAHRVVAESTCRLGDLDEAERHAIDAANIADKTHELVERSRSEAVLAKVALGRGRPDDALAAAARLDAMLQGRSVFFPWVLEAQAGQMEVALDLIERDLIGWGEVSPILTRGKKLLTSYARVCSIARPRLYLFEGRLAAISGRQRRARHSWAKALAEGERLDASWEVDRARHLLSAGRETDRPFLRIP